MFADDEPDYYELRPRKQSTRCVCGDDLPGTCPGQQSCPYSGQEENDETTKE